MSYRKQILLIVLAGIIMIIFGFVASSSYPELFGICNAAIPGTEYSDGRVTLSDIPENYCGHFSDAWSTIFVLGGITLSFSALLFLLFREEIFFKWRRFILWAIPIGSLLIISASTDPYGYSSFWGTDISKNDMSIMVMLFFSAITLIIIIQKILDGTSKNVLIVKTFNRIWKFLSFATITFVWGSGLISTFIGEPFFIGILFSATGAIPLIILMIIIFILLKRIKNYGLDYFGQRIFLIAIASALFSAIFLILFIASYSIDIM